MSERDVPEHWRREREEITRALPSRHRRRDEDGSWWYDGQCLFHEDSHASRSWNEQHGIYFCHVCGVIPVPEVLRRLGTPAQPSAFPEPAPSRKPARDRESAAVCYLYRFPDGRISHLKYRWERPKDFRIYGPPPEQRAGKPSDAWPLYGDCGRRAGLRAVILEGEKCVDALDALHLDGYFGVTAGSASDLQRQSRFLCQRLKELEVEYAIFWPDADDPGLAILSALQPAAAEAGLAFGFVDPRAHDFPRGFDLVDYLQQYGAEQLPELLELQPGRGSDSAHTAASNGHVSALVAKSLVTQQRQVIALPYRVPVECSPEWAKSIYLNEYGHMPSAKEADEIAARWRLKSVSQPIRMEWRLHASEAGFWWRPRADGLAYHVGAEGISLEPDPPGVFLAVPQIEPEYPLEVDLDGSFQDFNNFCDHFGLNALERAMLEGWLVCGFCKLQTPILLMKGQADSGKTTLARLLIGLIEPIGAEINVQKGQDVEERTLIRALETMPAALLDNLSALPAYFEDTLSKLVTGDPRQLRGLYRDYTDLIRLRKPLCITTINWDPYKSDLASRIIIAHPQRPKGQLHMPDRVAQNKFGAMVPRLRGYIFQLAQQFYARRQQVAQAQTRFRVGDLGWVFNALGYDSETLAKQEAAAKALVLGAQDERVEAICEFWYENEYKRLVDVTPSQLQSYFAQQNVPMSTRALHRFLSEKASLFKDHGFELEFVQSNGRRLWRFKALSEAEEPELSLR